MRPIELLDVHNLLLGISQCPEIACPPIPEQVMITQCRQFLPSIDNPTANAESKGAVIFKYGVDEC